MGWYAWGRQELARIVRKVGFAVLVHACPVIALCYQVLINDNFLVQSIISGCQETWEQMMKELIQWFGWRCNLRRS
jgi:hypothetical protein